MFSKQLLAWRSLAAPAGVCSLQFFCCVVYLGQEVVIIDRSEELPGPVVLLEDPPSLNIPGHSEDD